MRVFTGAGDWRLYQRPTWSSSTIASSATEREPGDARLSARHHDERRQQGPERLPGLAADLEQRLGEAVAAAGRQAGHACRLGMKHRRSRADEHGSDQQHGIIAGVRQHDEADQRASHAATSE
jgi:hypothetical protein